MALVAREEGRPKWQLIAAGVFVAATIAFVVYQMSGSSAPKMSEAQKAAAEKDRQLREEADKLAASQPPAPEPTTPMVPPTRRATKAP